MKTPAIIGSMRRAARNPSVTAGLKCPEMRIVAVTITASMSPCAAATMRSMFSARAICAS